MSHPTIGKAIYQPICFQISTQILPYINPYVPYIYIYIYISAHMFHMALKPSMFGVHFPHSRGPSGLEFRTRSRLDVALGERGAAPRDHTRNAGAAVSTW